MLTRYSPSFYMPLPKVKFGVPRGERVFTAGGRQGDAFASLLPRALMKRAHAPKKIAPPVDKLKLVTPYPKARATMTETTLSTLVPLGTPIVMHLYTG